MTKQGVEQNGQLSQHPLGELIREAAATRLSGAFRVAETRVKSVIYFDTGQLVFAVSNVRAHRLSESARKWNFVTQQQLTAAGTQKSDVQLGMALVESGALTSDSLIELLSLQTASVLRPVLLWTEGSWSFDPRVRLAEKVQVQINLHELLMESARRLPPEYVAKRFDNTNEVVSMNSVLPFDLTLQPIEAFVLSRIGDAQMRLHELLNISGLPDVETYCSLYVLALGGFVNRERWSKAFSEDTVSRFRAVDAAVEKTQKEAAGTEPPVVIKPTPPKAPKTTTPEPEVDNKEEIDRFFFRVEAAEDFYEVLAVTRSADTSAVKKAYHALARRFHPDRFHQEAGTPLHARLQATFARVAQAYEMLKDSKLRASYDLRLQAEKRMRSPSSFSSGGTSKFDSAMRTPPSHAPVGNKTGNSDSSPGPESAEETFQRGVAALQAGNLPAAIALLADAVRREPSEARYRANYGRALSSNKPMRHQAETELKTAISLDGNNASYRLMLAVLYSENGMNRRAQAEAQRVLVVDPYNVDALRLLQSLAINK